jgi:hypothetical protein
MKESPEPLFSPSFLGEALAGLVVEGDEVRGVVFALVHHLLVGVSDRGPDLQALKLIGRLRSATARRRVLRGGLLSERDRSCPLGKLLWVSGGSPAGARPTGLLAVLGATFLTFASHLPSRRNETRVRQ